MAGASGPARLLGGSEDKKRADDPEYRALVCVTLGGGADSFNLMVPSDPSGYRDYADRRGDLALRQCDLLPLRCTDELGRSFGLHCGLKEATAMFNAGELAILANAGPLHGLTTSKQNLRTPDLSHSEFITFWQCGMADHSPSSGWAGRVADVLAEEPQPDSLPVNISVSGRNIMQLGNSTAGADLRFEANRQRGYPIVGVDFSYVNQQLADRALNTGRPGFVRRRTQIQANTEIEYWRIAESALSEIPELSVGFETDAFSADLQNVARLISARHQLGAKRQIFFVHFDGWDHHHGLLESQDSLAQKLSRGLAAFRDALEELDVFDSVTTFTTSEFGRSLDSNGNGSDHGWGGHHMVMGGSVRGGRVYGHFPELARSSPLDVGGGSFVPTTSMDEYLAEMALWLGTPSSDLSYVLPDLSNFWSASAGQAPIGLLV